MTFLGSIRDIKNLFMISRKGVLSYCYQHPLNPKPKLKKIIVNFSNLLVLYLCVSQKLKTVTFYLKLKSGFN